MQRKFRDGVLAHESHGRNGAKGHQGQIEFGASFSCGRVPFILEAFVGFGQEAEQRVCDVVTEGWKSIAHGASHEFVHSNYSNVPYYEVVDTLTAIDEDYPHITYIGDLQISEMPTDSSELAPDPRWKCRRL